MVTSILGFLLMLAFPVGLVVANTWLEPVKPKPSVTERIAGAVEAAPGVLLGLGSCLALLAIGAFWCLLFVAVARVALG